MYDLHDFKNFYNFTRSNKEFQIMIQKNIFAALIIFTSLLFSCQSEADKETDKTDADNKNETEKLSELTYTIPQELKLNISEEKYLFDRFYPIGISDEAFAYIIEPADEATGYYFFNLIIKKIKSGEVLWTFRIDEKDAFENTGIHEIWARNKALFIEKLRKFEIKPKQDFSLGKLPKKTTPKFDAKINRTYAEKANGWGIQNISSAEIELRHEGESITVYEEKFPDALTVNVKLHGYIKLGKHTYALIFSDERIGYEGPPNVLTIKLIPFSL